MFSSKNVTKLEDLTVLTKRHIEYIFIFGMPDSLLFSYLIYIVDKYILASG